MRESLEPLDDLKPMSTVVSHLWAISTYRTLFSIALCDLSSLSLLQFTVIVDLKGHRYQGSILPGPTALVVSVVKGGKLKAESITDEFVTLSKATNVMKSLDAIVKGQYDEGFKVREENVNKMAKQASADTPSAEEENKKGATTAKTKKRASVSSSKSSTKKKKKP